MNLDGLIGCQTPRLAHYPTYFTTLGDDAIDLAGLCGIELLPWQEDIVRYSLGERVDGQWAASSVCLIIPRQNGKNVCVYARQLAGLFLLGERIMHCLAVDTPVLTRDRGFQPVSELTLDDWVYSPSGDPIKVIGKSPVWLNHDCYRVRTTDGREVVVDGGHRWKVIDRNHQVNPVRRGEGNWFQTVTMTTRALVQAGLELAGGSPNAKRFALPRQEAVQKLPERDLPLDPYILGAWLGDGFSNGAVQTAAPSDVPYWREEYARLGVETSQHAKPYNIGILSGTYRKLADLGLINNKHVPEDYLLAADWQREALLQGLMDTDGTASGGRASFTNTNRDLVDAVAFLARSLGWRVAIDESAGKGKPKYRVKWTPALGDAYRPFRMPRKVAELKPSASERRFAVSIESIVKVDSVPVSCIKVDSPDELFLAGRDLVVTANSAHEFDTCRDAHRELTQFIGNCPDLEDLCILPHKVGAAEMSIRHAKNKGFIHYVARGKNAKRGRTRVDLMVFDEAFALDDDMMAAMSPLQQASKNPQRWFTTSAGTEDSIVLTRIRDRGKRLHANPDDEQRLLFAEWSCEEGSDPHDFENWKIANPSLGVPGIAPVEFLREDYEQNMSIAQFAREHLGMWDDPSMNSVIDMDAWKACITDSPPPVPGDRAVCIDVEPNRKWASIAIAEKWPDGRHHVAVIAHDKGTNWILPKMQKLIASPHPPKVAVVQMGLQSGSFAPELEQIGYKVLKFGPRDVGEATMQFEDDIMARRLTHDDDVDLVIALGGATKYFIGNEEYAGAWGWLRKNPSVDITGIVACSYANRALTLASVEETLNTKKPGRLLISGLY